MPEITKTTGNNRSSHEPQSHRSFHHLVKHVLKSKASFNIVSSHMILYRHKSRLSLEKPQPKDQVQGMSRKLLRLPIQIASRRTYIK